MHLKDWLGQRENRVKYDGTDAVWLNRKGNRYQSGPLNNLLRNLLEEAGIQDEGRKLVWYSFRHSTGQYVYTEADKQTAATVLRHKDTRSTERYAGPTHEQIQQAQREANK